MSQQIVIHLKSGQNVKGALSRPFNSSDIDIEVVTPEENRRLLFSLEEIGAIAFSQTPLWFKPNHPEVIEEVQMTSGESFRVRVCSAGKCKRGFLGLPTSKSAIGHAIFFTNSGVRFRSKDQQLGQILMDHQIVSREQIAETLEDQTKLRNRRIGEVISDTASIPRAVVEKTLEKAYRKPAGEKPVRVGDILVEAGLVTREQVEQAFATQESGKKLRVGELLLSRGMITEEQLLQALAAKFCVEFVDLSTITPSEEALAVLSEGLVDRLQVIPVALDDRTLTIATSAPTDSTIKDSVSFSTGLSIELIIATKQQITTAIGTYYHRSHDVIDNLLSEMDEVSQVVTEEDIVAEDATHKEADSAVIALVNRLLIDAYKRGASDLHFEPGVGKSPLLVRYRIDGECEVAHRIADTYKRAIISRLKIISGLDIAERRRPQSGKVLLHFRQDKLEFRVEVTPIVGGQEDVVLRLLSASKPLPLAEMGLMPYNLDRFRALLEKPYGLILCVGPTGSGKTTTLHSAIGHINNPKRKILTVEDPVEITQAGLRQVPVNHKLGFNFAEALRSFLRADPDVIMIGEMRDPETAKIAIEASLTGHLVFSTLHTNSAPETVVRLIDMGLDPLNFAEALLGIVAQRLVRQLCSDCKQAFHPSREAYEEVLVMFKREVDQVPTLLPNYEDTVFMKKTGCKQCGETGYRGRLALHEFLLGTAALKQAIRKGHGVDELREIALMDGMWTLRMDGAMKIFTGDTDLEQVNKVCL